MRVGTRGDAEREASRTSSDVCVACVRAREGDRGRGAARNDVSLDANDEGYALVVNVGRRRSLGARV